MVTELTPSGISAPIATITSPIRAEADGIFRSSTQRLTITVIRKEKNEIQANDMRKVTRYRFSWGLNIRQSGHVRSMSDFKGNTNQLKTKTMVYDSKSDPVLSSRSGGSSIDKSSEIGTDKRGYDGEDVSVYLSRKTDPDLCHRFRTVGPRWGEPTT
jgi:hypothetical protein